MSEVRPQPRTAAVAQQNLEDLVAQYEGRAFALYELLVPGAEGVVEGLTRAFSRTLKASENQDEKRALETLIYREVISSAVDFLQANGGAIPEESGWQPSVLPQAVMGKVDSAVHGLPLDYRIVFSLREVLRLQSSLVGEILSITELEIRAYLHRARLMLFRVMRAARS